MTNKILKASGVIVILLGVMMINNGLALTGTGYDFNSAVGFVTASAGADIDTESIAVMEDGYQVITMTVTRYGWDPDMFIIQKDIPVKWIIQGEEITGCNNAIQVPKLGLKFDLIEGEQIIEFTPTEEGVVSWSCWMGMIPGSFIVVEDITDYNSEEVEESITAAASASTGGSCGSSGGCGCGG